MRIDCDLEAFKGCFVDVVDKGWTWGEIIEWGIGALTAHNASLVQKKTKAIHLVTVDGLAIDSADELTDENLARVDYELYVWLATAYQHAVNQMQELTKKNVRTSLGIPVAKA